MATKIVILQYQINLSDLAQVAALTSVSHEGGATEAVIKAPDQAAIDYKPVGGSTLPILIKPYEFVAPSITSEWFGTGDHFPTNVAKFDRKSGGWFGIPLLFGDTTHYYWRGLFVYSPPIVAAGIIPGAPAPISQRRWIDGFELPENGEGSAGGSVSLSAPMASRHCEGMGFALRSTTTPRVHSVAENQAGYTPNRSWERLYIRVITRPAAGATFWRSRGSVEGATGLILWMLPAGQIAVIKVSNTGAYELVASTATIDLNRWYRLDILHEFGAAAKLQLYLDGVQALNIQSFSAGGMASSGRTHLSSEIGDTLANTLAIDIDDWMCADWPATLDGLDWINGSHMCLVRPQGRAGSDTGAWAGDFRVLMQRPTQSASATLTSSTSLARLAVTTDAAYTIESMLNTIGCAAVAVCLNSSRGAASGQLGYSIAGGAEVLTAIVQTVAQAWNTVLYRPAALTEALKIAPLEISHIKGVGADASSVWGLFAVAEVLGKFGTEDLTTTEAAAPIAPGHTGIHNAPYPRTPWAQLGQPPQSPVILVSGTYVGNGTGQDLTFRAPVHFLRIRPLTGDTGGVTWWSSQLGPHPGGAEAVQASLLPRAEVDLTFLPAAGEDQQQTRYLLRLGGNHSQSNAAGVTYAYFAFCDPGMRFALNGALVGHKGTADIATALAHPTFSADFLWLLNEVLGATATTRLYVKGPANAAASVSQLSTAELANALTIAPGVLTAKTAYFTVNSPQQIAFAGFRKDDGSGDPGVPRVVQILSYVGDGAASRTFSLLPASGRRPVWALISPTNGGVAIFRDPSHTGVTSTQAPSTVNASTGITAGGIDQISIGSALNVNGVSYNVISFPGDTVAGNGGWSIAGEFVPVDPAPPTDGPWDPMPEDPDDPGPGGAVIPGPETPAGSDFATSCVAATTKIANIALSRLGVTKQIGNVGTDQTLEATVARLHYQDALEAVLRAFPWPFATRYATLTLVAGSDTVPVNDDWTYSYRAPSDMVYARRFVGPAGEKRLYDPEPEMFRVGSDATGALLYTDLVAADATLEYTVRPACAASSGDALFRSALAWRLAHEMAPGLSRDQKKIDYCWAMFEHQVAQAKVAAANEAQQDPDQPDAPWITGR